MKFRFLNSLVLIAFISMSCFSTGCGKKRDKPDTDPPVEELTLDELGIEGGESDTDETDDVGDKKSSNDRSPSDELQLNPPSNG